jgi:hypothetical protein
MRVKDARTYVYPNFSRYPFHPSTTIPIFTSWMEEKVVCGNIAIDGQAKQNGQSQLDVQNRTKKNSLAGPHGTTRQWTKNGDRISKIIVNQDEKPQPTKLNRKQRFRVARKQRKRARIATDGTTEARVSTNGTKATQDEPCNKKIRKN